MFNIKNAIKNIYRYKSRYISFAVMFFAALCIASVSVSLLFYASHSIELLKKEYAGNVKLRMRRDYKNVNKDSMLDAILSYEKSQYVESITLRKNIFSTAQTHTGISPDGYSIRNAEVHLTTDDKTEQVSGDVYVMGYNFEALSAEEISRFDIETGRMYENGDECVIAVNGKLNYERDRTIRWNIWEMAKYGI